MKEKKPIWEQRQLRWLDNLFLKRDFHAAVGKVKAGEKAPIDLFRQFDVPLQAVPYIMYYLETGDKSDGLISPPVTIVSEADETVEPAAYPAEVYQITRSYQERNGVKRVLLELDPNVTRVEIDDFLNRYFTSHIVPKLKLVQDRPTKPLRSSPTAADKERIYELSDAGMSAADIAAEPDIGFEYDNIRKILERRGNRDT